MRIVVKTHYIFNNFNDTIVQIKKLLKNETFLMKKKYEIREHVLNKFC